MVIAWHISVYLPSLNQLVLLFTYSEVHPLSLWIWVRDPCLFVNRSSFSLGRDNARKKTREQEYLGLAIYTGEDPSVWLINYIFYADHFVIIERVFTFCARTVDVGHN